MNARSCIAISAVSIGESLRQHARLLRSRNSIVSCMKATSRRFVSGLDNRTRSGISDGVVSSASLFRVLFCREGSWWIF